MIPGEQLYFSLVQKQISFLVYYVYVLQSQKDKKYYIGSTSNLVKRVDYHNSGKQRSTKHRIPFILAYFEEFESKSEALKREKQIKNYKGGEAFQKLINKQGM